MRPGRILHPELAKALATCGHTDIILVTDAGFPIPKDANRIDLGYYAGAVDVLDILKMLRKEIFVEEVAFAPEVKDSSSCIVSGYSGNLYRIRCGFKGIPHEQLVEEIAPKAKVGDSFRIIKCLGEFCPDLQYRSVCLVYGRRCYHSSCICRA